MSIKKEPITELTIMGDGYQTKPPQIPNGAAFNDMGPIGNGYPVNPLQVSNGAAVFTVDEKGNDLEGYDGDNDNKPADEEDPWALIDPPSVGKPWGEKTCKEKFTTTLFTLLKVLTVIGLLYLFVCSLDFLSSAFRLLGGEAVGNTFKNSDVLGNPIAGLMIGVLATVLLQSSSTTTSIVVAMVGAGVITIRPAIFMVMGANIGTSVTNTLVAFTQVTDRNEFRRAFAGATVHDMFNWLSVIIMLPLEWLTGLASSTQCGMLCQITSKMVEGVKGNSGSNVEFLKVITKPFTNRIILVDKKIITDIATNQTEAGAKSLIKTCHENVLDGCACTARVNGTGCVAERVYSVKEVNCGFLFEDVAKKWSDEAVGVCLLLLAIFVLCVCLVLIVKILHSMLRGTIASVIKKFLNAKFPGPARHLTGYVAILLGAGFTMLVQSSSIFTSAITPLVGVGVLHIKRMYPLTLGSNIGTTFTAILAALASDPDALDRTMQIALCHLLFNIMGIAIWYPVPFLRSIPISMAMSLGDITAKYRWFAAMYLIMAFGLLPLSVFGLSMAGWQVLLGVGIPIVLIVIFIVVVKVLQKRAPRFLPVKLRTWKWLPVWLRSLEPYDNVFKNMRKPTCCKHCGKNQD